MWPSWGSSDARRRCLEDAHAGGAARKRATGPCLLASVRGVRAQQPYAGKQSSSGQIQVVQAIMMVLWGFAQAGSVPCLCTLERHLHVCCGASRGGCIGVQ